MPKAIPYFLALASSGLAIGLALLLGADAADQALLAARWTARVAIPLFLVAYLARPLHKLAASRLTKAILANRRQWGLAFALSMAIHLVALLVNILIFRPRGLGEIAAGMGAYALIFIMAATSNDGSMRRLGKWWKRLHLFGLHYIWFIFFAGRVLRALGDDPSYHLAASVSALVLLAALAIRVAASPAWRRARARSVAQ